MAILCVVLVCWYTPSPAQTFTWENVGGPSTSNGDVYAILPDGSGNVYVAGTFTSIVGTSANRIAKWNGASWSALGTGLSGNGFSLATDGTNIYVGGNFVTAGGVTVNRIGKWDGSSWSAVGTGFGFGSVNALAVSGSDIYAGGSFVTNGDGDTVNYIARWNGSSWVSLGSGLGAAVRAITISDTNVYAGGDFQNAGGVADADYVARWDGSSWNALAAGVNNYVSTIAVSGSDVYIGGNFTNVGSAAGDYAVKWNGASWSALGTVGTNITSSVTDLVFENGELYAAGTFSSLTGGPGDRVAKWDGSSWTAVVGGADSYVLSMAPSYLEGKMYVGGGFASVDSNDVTASRIARFADSVNALPITLGSFTVRGNAGGSGVLLDWMTVTEINNYGFFVERRGAGEPNFSIISELIPGAGTTTEPRYYSWLDNTLTQTGHYHYRLRQQDLDGTIHYSWVESIEITTLSVTTQPPVEFRVFQNYPNPFNPTTTITFSVEQSERATVSIYNNLGQKVLTLFDQIAEPGRYYRVELNGSTLASGVYFYRVATLSRSDLKGMLLVK